MLLYKNGYGRIPPIFLDLKASQENLKIETQTFRSWKTCMWTLAVVLFFLLETLSCSYILLKKFLFPQTITLHVINVILLILTIVFAFVVLSLLKTSIQGKTTGVQMINNLLENDGFLRK